MTDTSRQHMLRVSTPPQINTTDAITANAMMELGERFMGRPDTLLLLDDILWPIWPPCQCARELEPHELLVLYREKGR